MSPRSKALVAPSILSADFARLGDELIEAEAGGADWIHVDVMDGHFVPNLTLGPPVIAALRPLTRLPLDVHLMIEAPERSISQYVEAGADRVTVHVETCPHLHRTIEMIRALGAHPGVCLNPATPLASVEAVLDEVDTVLVMSVDPGFGGQRYLRRTTARVAALRSMLDAAGSPAELEVDGGIGADNLEEVIRAGATVLVMGSAVFNARASVGENMQQVRRSMPA